MRVKRFIEELTLWVMLVMNVSAQADNAVQAVAYVEVLPAEVNTAQATFQRYVSASRQQSGLISMTLLQELARPNRWMVLESWRDQATWDTHATANTALQTSLQPLRLGSYDQRLYLELFTDAATQFDTDNALYVVTHVDIGGRGNADESLQQYCRDTRLDLGNLSCQVWQGIQRNNHFTLISTWRDQSAWAAHRAAAHTRQFREQIEPLTGSPIDERLYRLVQ